LERFVEAGVASLGGLDFVLHAIAWAPADDLHGRVTDSSRDGFNQAMAISCHTFAELDRPCEPHMAQGGTLVTMTYHGGNVAVPHYGIMGPVPAALEGMVRYMALELGAKKIRVHAVSPGPIMTRAALGDRGLRRAAEHGPSARAAAAPGHTRRSGRPDGLLGRCRWLGNDWADALCGRRHARRRLTARAPSPVIPFPACEIRRSHLCA